MNLNSKKNIVVAISGKGRSLQNLIKNQDDYFYNVCGVIVSSAKCEGLAIVQKYNLNYFLGDFTKPDVTHPLLYQWLKQINPCLIALAGFLKLMPVFDEFKDKIINIHPALLPKFGGKGMYGIKVHEAVLRAKETVSGATIHFVNEYYDKGAIIAQIKVPVLDNDTPQSLADRVFAAECYMYPRVIDELLKGSLPLKEGQIKFFNFEDVSDD